MFALVDCNNFFVSCEKVFQPHLEGKPVVVLSSNDGCIVARSNEAKAIGTEMGQPAFKCRDVLTYHKVKEFSSNFSLYSDMSNRVMWTLKDMAEKIEIYSVDEAFVDFSAIKAENKLSEGQKIQHSIQKYTGIPVTVGIGSSKTLAKAAAEYGKQIKQQTVEITPENREPILRKIPVQDIWGVGRKYSQKLNSHGIRTAFDLICKPDKWIKENMTIMGLRTVLELRGESVIAFKQKAKPKKSILSSRSFSSAVKDLESLQQAVGTYVSIAARKLRDQSSLATQMGVFLRNRKKYYSHKINLTDPTDHTPELIKQARFCLDKIYQEGTPYKKAGVYFSGLVPSQFQQTNLFQKKDYDKQKRFAYTVDQLNYLWGRDTVVHASTGLGRQWSAKCQMRSPQYTTSWREIPVIKI